MKRYVVFGILISLVLLATWDLGQRGARSYERMLIQRVENGLEVLGFQWAEIRADGLKLELHGHAPDVFAQELAIESAQATAPIAQVVNFSTATLAPPEHRDPIRIELHRDARGITLIGQSASRGMRDDLNELLEQHGGDLDVQDLTGIQAAQPSQSFGPELDVAAVAITALQNSFVVVEPGQVSVEAQAKDETERETVTQRLLDAAQGQVAVVMRLTTPSFVIAPFTFSANKDIGGGIRLEACASRSADERAALTARLDNAGVTLQSGACPVGLGGPKSDWLGAIDAGLNALQALPAGRLEISYRAARLVGLPPTSPKVFDEILNTFSGALPQNYTGDGMLRADDAVTKDGISRNSYWMYLVRDADGLKINGQIQNAVSRLAVTTYAAALFGADHITDNMQEMNAPAPVAWQDALLRMIELLDEAGTGEVQLAGRRVSVDAPVQSPVEAKLRHEALLANLPDYTVTTHFVVDLPSTYREIKLPAKRCAHELSKRIQARPIDFDTGSAVLTEESQRIMDQLAHILRRCNGDRIEIGGHTDAQGSEDLNLRLSQGRAEAVRNALAGRGISLDIMVARGYGEAMPIADNKTDAGRARNRRIEFEPAE